ncbi:MAG TPA: transcription antitermination factor NusB [Gaiellales bacterium]
MSARSVALRVLTRVFDEDAYADRAFTGEAERAKLDARDRGLAMHLAFGAVQRRRTLDAALEEIAGRPVQRLERKLAHVLQLGVFQILFADGIPPHAAVSESVELARREIGPRATGLTNAVLRRIASEGPEWYAALPEEEPEEAALRHSLPDWIAETWFEAYGAERARALCAASNEPPAVSLWPNPARDGEAVAEAWLRDGGLNAVRDEQTGVLRVDGAIDVAGSQAFASGAVVPIARAAVLVAQRAGAQAGMRVLDLCAAPGGKTAVLAATGAHVTAVDKHTARAKTLAATLRRLGVSAEVVAADGRTFRGEPYDRVLVDAPCSGLGVLAGRPDSRWRRSPEDVEELATLQVELVRHAATLLAPGGELHYAVCTLNPGENEATAEAAGMQPEDELRTWPDEGDDGFYAARLVPAG